MTSATLQQELSAWRSFHLFYHGERDRVLLDFLRPAAAQLLAEGLADRFYFMRYGLGGPHLRLRFRAVRGREVALAAAVERLGGDFLARHPSTASLPAAELERHQAAFLIDSQESDTAIYPDNSLVEMPPIFEIERYGGPELFPAALDFFGISSLEALAFLANSRVTPAAKLTTRRLRFLIRQAGGFAEDDAEFERLVGYALDTWGEAMPTLVQRGDETFDKQPEALVNLVLVELANLAAAPPPLAVAASALRRQVSGASSEVRTRLLSSQLHLSANRLGLLNPEEVYLGRILVRASRAAREAGSWSAGWPAVATPAAAKSCAELLELALADFQAAPSALLASL